MKAAQLLIFVLICQLHALSQADTIRYEQFGNSHEFSELALHPDSSFIYEHYNNRSCLTWHSKHGRWKIDNYRLVFTDTIHWEEDRVTLDTRVRFDSVVTIIVRNERGIPLPGIQVDYTPEWQSGIASYSTDEKGMIRISKSWLQQQGNKMNDPGAGIRIRYSHKKCRQCSYGTNISLAYDLVTVTINESFKEKDIIATTRYIIFGDKIYFESRKYSANKGYQPTSWGNFKLAEGSREAGKRWLLVNCMGEQSNQ